MSDRGQGRKPLSKDGELMKSRALRMTDATWADAKFIGMPEVRRLIEDAAKKKRRKAIERAKDPLLASREKQKENQNG